VSVAIWSRREERNAEAVAELEELGATAIGVQCDVSDEDNVVHGHDAQRVALIFRTGDSMVVDGGYTII
jgi:NAD(P)-dependent dehydrogenase (short-subunit alcohol dehydrogenase family)